MSVPAAPRFAAWLALLAVLGIESAIAQQPARAPPVEEPRGAPAPGLESLPDRAVWKRITLGRYRSVSAIREALEAARVRVGDMADEILGRPAFPYSRMPIAVDLLVLTPGDLGFTRETPLEDIERRAAQLGLDLCPAEVGPLVRLSYVDQPVGEFLRIAMKPVATWRGTPVTLTIANGGTGPILLGGESRPDFTFAPATRFVFVRPQRIASPDAR